MKKAFNIAATILAVNLFITSSRANDICDTLEQHDKLIIFGEEAANIVMDFDTAAHSICYSFMPLIKNMSVVPDHLCIRLGDEESSPIQLQFNNGSSYDISDVYNSEMTLNYYNFYMQRCLHTGLNI